MEKATQTKPQTQGGPEKGVSSPRQETDKWRRIAWEFFNAPATMGSFFHTLCKAIQRADMENLGRLRKGFPELVKYVKEGF